MIVYLLTLTTATAWFLINISPRPGLFVRALSILKGLDLAATIQAARFWLILVIKETIFGDECIEGKQCSTYR